MRHLNLKALRARDCLSYKQLDVTFGDKGLVLLSGSNGSGKSSITDLMTFLLYGKTSKGLGANKILNRYAQRTSYECELDFEVDGQDFSVNHTREATSKLLFHKLENGIPVSLTHKSNKSELKDTQSLISRVAGYSFEEFLSYVYLPASYTNSLVSGTPAERQACIAQAFGLVELDTVANGVKVKLGNLKTVTSSSPEALQLALDKITQEVSELQAQLASTEVSEAKEKELRSKLNKLHESYTNQKLRRSREQELATYLADKSYSGQSVKSLERALTQVDQELATTKQIISEHLTLVKIHKLLAQRQTLIDYADADLCSDLLLLLKNREVDAATHAALRELEASYYTLANVPDDVPATLLAHLERVSTLEAALQQAQKSLKQLEKLCDVSECPTCRTHLTPDTIADIAMGIRARVVKLESKLVSAKQDLVTSRALEVKYLQKGKLRDRIEQTKKLFLPLPAIANKYTNEQAKEYLAYHTRYKAITQELSFVDPALLSKAENYAVSDVSASEAKLVELKKQLVALRQDLAIAQVAHVLQQAIQAAPFSQEEYDSYKNRVHKASVRLEEYTNALAVAEEKQKRLTNLQTELARLLSQQQEQSQIMQRKRVLTVLYKSLKDLGSIRLGKATKLLTDNLPTYLDRLFHKESVYVTVAEDSSTKSCDLLFHKAGEPIPLTSLSSGQSRKLGLALMFAMQQASTKECNMLVLDEPFNNIEHESRQTCFEIIKDMSRTRFVVLISHDSDTQNMRYDARWKVKYDGKLSILETLIT